jgi:hypothetical protein
MSVSQVSRSVSRDHDVGNLVGVKLEVGLEGGLALVLLGGSICQLIDGRSNHSCTFPLLT